MIEYDILKFLGFIKKWHSYKTFYVILPNLIRANKLNLENCKHIMEWLGSQ